MGHEANIDSSRQTNRKDNQLKVKVKKKKTQVQKKKNLAVTVREIKGEIQSLLLVIEEAGGSFTSCDGRWEKVKNVL